MKNLNQYRYSKLMFIIIGITIINSSGCETAFEPLQESDQHIFSMYGAVDLHGEFTKVRVMPVGKKLIPTDPEPNGTEVTLIRNDTGEEMILRDSLARFGGNAYVWNYFTGETLHANEKYTLLASTPDEKQSTASINLPSALPVPEVEDYSTALEEGTFTGSSIEPVVSIQTRYYVQGINEFGCDPERELVFSHLDNLVVYANGEYRLEVRNRSAIGSTFPPSATGFVVNGRELLVIASGEDWPDPSGLSEEEMTLPDLITNVENGTGLVAGIAGRRVEITPRKEPC
ncbi:MAG: hypothetical protein WEA56_15905 [Balneolaceae bacterium]